MDKKSKILILGTLIVVVLTLAVGFTYAYWTTKKVQETSNIVTTGCFDISLSNEQNAINLEKAYPISDEEGSASTPFTFTVTNTCDTAAEYTLNLEMLEDTTLSSEYVAVKLNTKGVKKLSDYQLGDKLQTTSTEARKLETRVLNPGESKNFELRLWMDKDVTLEDDAINKTLSAKVTVTAGASESKATSVLKATNYSDTTAFRSNTYKQKIKNITFEDEINIPETVTAEEQWDISEAQDGSIMSYVVPNTTEGYYDLYIQSNNKIEANSNMSSWFANFNYLNTINGLDLVDTSNTTDMTSMFNSAGYNATTFILDLSNMDFSNVTNMSMMFNGTGRNATILNINLSNMNLSSVTSMYCMFQSAGNASKDITIDLSNTDTSKVTNMSYMFHSVGGSADKININLNGFDTNSVTNMQSMFQYFCQRANYTLDLSSFDTSNVTNMKEMFRESGNYTESFTILLSNFDTSKVTDMSFMFYDVGHASSNLDLNITIRNSQVSNYTQMFKYSACKAGGNITVNYTAETSELVDLMIATKTEGCNVVKGIQVD